MEETLLKIYIRLSSKNHLYTNKHEFMTNKHEYINEKVLEAELCYKIQGCIFNVANKYGKGLKEQIYQKALAE